MRDIREESQGDTSRSRALEDEEVGDLEGAGGKSGLEGAERGLLMPGWTLRGSCSSCCDFCSCCAPLAGDDRLPCHACHAGRVGEGETGALPPDLDLCIDPNPDPVSKACLPPGGAGVPLPPSPLSDIPFMKAALVGVEAETRIQGCQAGEEGVEEG